MTPLSQAYAAAAAAAQRVTDTGLALQAADEAHVAALNEQAAARKALRIAQEDLLRSHAPEGTSPPGFEYESVAAARMRKPKPLALTWTGDDRVFDDTGKYRGLVAAAPMSFTLFLAKADNEEIGLYDSVENARAAVEQRLRRA